MQTFSLSNIDFEAFGTIAYKKELYRVAEGCCKSTNRNLELTVYTVPESGSTFIDFSDIVRSQNSGNVTVAVGSGVQTQDKAWSWVSLNGVSPYKNIIPPAKTIIGGGLASQVPVTFNIVRDDFSIKDNANLSHEEITNNIPLQFFFNQNPQLQYQILLDNNDDVFWQSRLQYDDYPCENLAYLEWESEVGTTKGWIFEILDTQKKNNKFNIFAKNLKRF